MFTAIASDRSMWNQIATLESLAEQGRKIGNLESYAVEQGRKISNLENCVMEQDRKIAILESRAAEQDRIIAPSQSRLDSLIDRPHDGSHLLNLGLTEEPTNHPEDRTAGSNSSFVSTGGIFLNSFEACLRNNIDRGDIDLSKVLEVLRAEAFRYLKNWQPRRAEIKRRRKALIKAILSPRHIHKFTDYQKVFTGGMNSVWPSIIVAQVFPEATGNEQLRRSLINYCMKTAKGNGFFGRFASIVVGVHRRYCQRCGVLD